MRNVIGMIFKCILLMRALCGCVDFMSNLVAAAVQQLTQHTTQSQGIHIQLLTQRDTHTSYPEFKLTQSIHHIHVYASLSFLIDL